MMITQPKIKAGKQKKKMEVVVVEPEPVKDKQYFVKKCVEFANGAQNRVIDKIQAGEIAIRDHPLHIEFQDKLQGQGVDRDIKDKLNSLNEDLESLQREMMQQREQQRKREESKKKQARLLIDRLKKQKEEHRNRIKFNQISHRLKDSVYSEDVLRMMKEHREKLVLEKKKDMELKIFQNLNRKGVREDENAKKQISYWVKVQELEGKKRYHSTKALPRIQTNSVDHRQQPQLGVNTSKKSLVVPRKNSLFHKKSKSKQDILDYPEIIQRFIERAKAKQESQSERSPDKSRAIYNQPISEREETENPQLSRLDLGRNQKVDQIMMSHALDKRKKLGDEYLKESLLRVRSPKNITKGDQSMIEQSMELKANPAIFSRNDKLSNLEERRNKVLNNLLTGKIDKPLAIQMLHPLENKLDRIHPTGIQTRLKNKLEVFEEHQKKHQKIKIANNQNDPWEESSEHGI